MTYNTDRRPHYSKKQRAAFLEEEHHTCYWCGQPILPGQPWAIEHVLARELQPPGGDADARENLKAIHDHPAACHKTKTALDRKIIAKSNRIRRSHGPIDDRKKTRHPIKGGGFRPGHRPLKSRNTFTKRKPPHGS